MAGWDPRPIAQALGPDQSNNGYPWLFGHLFWTRGSPTQVAGAISDAIAWAKAHPRLRVGPQSSPLVVVEAWNETSEGSWIVPTVGDGYAYGQAIAQTLGLPWASVHTRKLTVRRVQRHVVYGTLSVDDHWTPCQVAPLQVQRQNGTTWTTLDTATTSASGSFSIRVPNPARYRITVAATSAYQQSCGAAASSAFVVRH